MLNYIIPYKLFHYFALFFISWPLMIRKVVRQQIKGDMVVLFHLPSQILSEFSSEKKLWNSVRWCRSYHKNESGPLFETRGRVVGLSMSTGQTDAGMQWTVLPPVTKSHSTAWACRLWQAAEHSLMLRLRRRRRRYYCGRIASSPIGCTYRVLVYNMWQHYAILQTVWVTRVRLYTLRLNEQRVRWVAVRRHPAGRTSVTRPSLTSSVPDRSRLSETRGRSSSAMMSSRTSGSDTSTGKPWRTVPIV